MPSDNTDTVGEVGTAAIGQLGGDAVVPESNLVTSDLYEHKHEDWHGPDVATATHTILQDTQDLELGSKEDCHVAMDVEHAVVKDDPRLWSNRRKVRLGTES